MNLPPVLKKKVVINQDDGLMTSSEVASVFKVHRKTVNKWGRDGCLGSFKTPGGNWRFRSSEVVAALMNGNMELTCDVCSDEPAVGVAAVPFVPISVAYGRRCLDANAHPYGIVVANTALAGGYESCVPEWKQIVDDTLAHLNKTREEFYRDVAVVEEDPRTS